MRALESEVRTRQASELSGGALERLVDCSRRRCHYVLHCINVVLYKGKTWRAATSGQKAIDKSEACVGEVFQVSAVREGLDRSKVTGRPYRRAVDKTVRVEIIINDDDYLQAVDGRCQRRSACSIRGRQRGESERQLVVKSRREDQLRPPVPRLTG